MLDALHALAQRALAVWLGPRTLGNVALIALVVLFVAYRRAQPVLPRQASFRTDLAYALFYVGGFYAFLLADPVHRWLGQVVTVHAPALQAGLLAWLPAPLHLLLALVLLDGVAYGFHRLCHASPSLWAFHGIHHSQQELTPLTNFRFHCVELLLRSLVLFVPALLLGLPQQGWLLLIWLQTGLDTMAHSGLDWRYGRLGAVLVSPAYHRLHHSADAREGRRNFAFTFSVWDRIFGTAQAPGAPPAAYGAPDLDVPESFARQFVFPFAHLARAWRPVRASVDPGEPEA